VPRASAPSPSPSPPPSPQPPLPARWVDSTWNSNQLGPTIPGGTLVVVGGKRAILTKDGVLRAEQIRAPEPIRQLITVPTAQGVRIFGLSPRGIYRFDDPLGEATLFARSEKDFDLRGIMPGPGVLAVMRAGGAFTFFDVETGRPTSLPGLPPAPLKSIAFRSMREGAAIFAGVGLALTRDGGASFHLPSESLEGDAQRVRFVGWDGDAIRTHQDSHERPPYRFEGTLMAKVDFAGQRLLPFVSLERLPDERPLARWLARAADDPLEVAASSGIEAPGGSALVAKNNLLARIDLRTGNVIALDDLTAGEHPLSRSAWCHAVRGGSGVFLGCSLAGDAETHDRERRLEVRRMAIEKLGLPLDPPELVRRGTADMSAAPGGGAMIVTHAQNEKKTAYARQPDGRWAPVRSTEAEKGPESFWRDHAAGPLADGRIALVYTHVRGGASITSGGKGGATAGLPGSPEKAGVEIDVATIDIAGNEERVASAFLEGANTRVLLASPIEQTRGGALRFTVIHQRPGEADERIPYIGTARPGEAALSLKPVPGADVALLRGDHGLAYGKERVLITSDGGESFAEIPAPPALARTLKTSEGEDFQRVSVSEVGAHVFGSLLIGWGPAEPLPGPRPDISGVAPIAADFKPDRSEKPPLKPARALACSGQDRSPAPPLFDAGRAWADLGREPVPPGKKRVSHVLENLLYALEAPEDAKGPPAVLTVRWEDRADPINKPRAWTGPAPEAISARYPNVQRVTFAGSEVIFAVHAGVGGSPAAVVRVKEGGAAEAVEAPGGVGSDIVMGAGEGAPVAWLNEGATTLFVWARGGPARAVARLAPRSDVRLNALVGDTVTLVMGALGWVVPVPSLAAGAAGAAGAATKPIAPEPVSFQPVKEPGIDVIPVCAGALPKGRELRWGPPVTVKVDGVSAGPWNVRYDLRGAGKDACIAGVSAVDPNGYPFVSEEQASLRGPSLLSRINVDFAGRRAAGLEREISTFSGRASGRTKQPTSSILLAKGSGATTRRMKCALLANR
jgi:hypothetical protein